tara:strand:+ start:15866 stop:16639 length:774 start_codon:yes stop_codon:yes gene_type:complete
MLQLKTFPNVIFIILIATSFFLANKSLATELEQTTKWYQIEYIVFEHLQTDDHILRYEDIPYPVKTNKQFSYVTTNAQPASAYQYTQLPENDMELANTIQKLKRSRAVEILDTHAWQQPLIEDAITPPIKINTEVSKQRTLFGELQLKKSRYTHAEFKLFLTQKITVPYKDMKDWFLDKNTKWKLIDLLTPITSDSTFTATIGTSEIYQNIRYLGESRRIKEGEIHYIDHPVISVIITMKEVPSPYKLNTNLSYVGQ